MKPPIVIDNTRKDVVLSDDYELVVIQGVNGDVCLSGNNGEVVVTGTFGHVLISGSTANSVAVNPDVRLPSLRATGDVGGDVTVTATEAGLVLVSGAVGGDVTVTVDVGGSVVISGSCEDVYLNGNETGFGDVSISAACNDVYITSYALGATVITGLTGNLYLSVHAMQDLSVEPLAAFGYVSILTEAESGPCRVIGESDDDINIAGVWLSVWLDVNTTGGFYLDLVTTEEPSQDGGGACPEPPLEPIPWCCPEPPKPSGSIVYPWPVESDEGDGGNGGIGNM